MRLLKNQIGWCIRAQWALGTGLAAALLLFFVAGYRPAVSSLASLHQQIESRQRELERNQTRANNLPALAAAVQKLQEQVRTFDRKFPRQPEIDQFIRDMTQISQQLSLADWRYQPGAPRRTKGFFELPILMSFRGDFLNAASFLKQVEDLQRLTRVKRFWVRSKESQNGAVEVEMTVSIYFSEQ